MSRPEGPRRALAMDVELLSLAVDLVLLDLAGVVRDVVEQRQFRPGEELGEGLPRQMRQDLAIGQGAVDAGAHRAVVLPAHVGLDRGAGQFPVGQLHAVLGGRLDHAGGEVRGDLVAQAPRAAVDHHGDVVEGQAEGLGDARRCRPP